MYPHRVILHGMPSESPWVDGVEEVFIVSVKKAVGVDDEPLPGCEHLHLSLHPICFGYRELLALVGLYFVDDIVLSVKVHSQTDAMSVPLLHPNLSVSVLDAKEVEDAMLIGRACCRVLVGEVPLGDAELDVPPFGEGVGLPISHDGCRIGSTSTKPTFSAMVGYHKITSFLMTGVVRAFSASHPRFNLERITK